MPKLIRFLLPFLLGVGLAAVLGLFANVVGLGEGATYAVMGALIAILVCFSLPYAFGVELFGVKGARGVHTNKATVVADEGHYTHPVADGDCLVLTDSLDEGFVWRDTPVVLATRETLRVDTLRVEVREEPVDLGRPFHLGAS
jgi:hypothetical protein